MKLINSNETYIDDYGTEKRLTKVDHSLAPNDRTFSMKSKADLKTELEYGRLQIEQFKNNCISSILNYDFSDNRINIPLYNMYFSFIDIRNDKMTWKDTLINSLEDDIIRYNIYTLLTNLKENYDK